jgi:small subunit ribosomal protein S7
MARKKRAQQRPVDPDPKYGEILVTRFINSLLTGGKRATAEGIFYGAMDIIQNRTQEEGIKVFKKALDNVKPLLEVKSRRVGGATYQVPIEVKNERGISLAGRWVIESARGRSEHAMGERLASELLEASNGRGGAMKKREDMHRMAEANRAFSHFRW